MANEISSTTGVREDSPIDNKPAGQAGRAVWLRRCLPGLWPLKLLLLAAICYYVGRAMARQLAQVPWGEIHLQPQFLVASLLLVCTAMFASAVGYRILMGGFTQAPSLGAMCAVTWLPSMGKYLPGKVASVAGAIWLLGRYRVPPGIAASAIMVQQVLGLLTGFLLALPLCFWQPIRERFPLVSIGLLLAPLVGLVCVHPAVLGPAVNLALRCFGRPRLPSVPSFRQYLPTIAWNTVGWVSLGTATWMVVRSMTHISPTLIVTLTAATALANCLGLLTLIPGGLGVREGVMLVILTPLTGPVTSVVVVVMRLVVIVAEVLLAGVGLLIVRRFTASAVATVGEAGAEVPAKTSG